MKRMSIMSRSAAIIGLLAGATSVRAQEAADRIEPPKCSFVCAIGGGAPGDVPPVATADPVQVRAVAPGLMPHASAAGGRKIAAATQARVRHIAAKAPLRRPDPAVADAQPPAVQAMSHPEQAAAVVDLRRADVTSPVVQIESEHLAEVDAIAPRRVAERASDDLHLDAGVATGDVEVSGFTRYAPSWDWLITQAHAATVRRPDPYGDLGGVRKVF